MVNCIGGYSWFQLFATIVIILPEIPASMIAISPILTGTSQVAYECETEDGIYSLTQSNVCSYKNCTGPVSAPAHPASAFTSIVQEVCVERIWIFQNILIWID